MAAHPLLKKSFSVLTFAILITFITIFLYRSDVPQSLLVDAAPAEGDVHAGKDFAPPLLDSIAPPEDDASAIRHLTPSSEESVLPPKNTPRPTNVTVFVENFDGLNAFYGNTFTKMESDIPRTCKLPHGGSCILQHSEASAQTADVVFRMVRFIHPGDTVRYHEGQLLAVMNTKAERGEYGLQQLREADIKIDHHLSSEIMWAEICGLPVHKWETSPPPCWKNCSLAPASCCWFA